jgi:hypothetical protein
MIRQRPSKLEDGSLAAAEGVGVAVRQRDPHQDAFLERLINV